MTPRATYRLQFTPDFGFDDAARIVPYLARLGVSHLYASPYLKARPGSTHGYDIVDHGALNPELGDEAAFARLNTALKQHDLGQIVDFVPNHMGVGGADNPAWLDVLEWGADSDHAGWFDIDWQNDRPYLQDKLLVPFLGNQYGAELYGGKLALNFDAEAGSFAVWAYDSHKLPITPADYGLILSHDDAVLDRIGDDFAHMASWRPQIRARAEALKADLADAVRRRPEVAAALDAAMARFAGEPGKPVTWQPLDALIRRQHWRPAHFRVAADDINYRRFFNINDLAGLRMELSAVFDHAHGFVFGLMEQGLVDGLRIDHVDGLFDPKAYLERLRAAAPRRPDGEPFYLVVEKILAQGERLRDDWPVQGTTGYETTNLLLGLMINPEAETAFSRIYTDFTGQATDYAEILRGCKKQIMDNEMASELGRLARSAARVARQNPATEDFTQDILRRALREIIACFPVYRTYLDPAGAPSREDRHDLDAAIAAARPCEPAIDDSVYGFLRRLLIGDLVAGPGSGYSRNAVLRCAMKLQQYSGPVMAKGLEDTAFYRYNRFIALNEVGGHPDHFGSSIAEFHAANAERAGAWPAAMLSTSTHDTKRGEDTRARLAALSECADLWEASIVQLGPWLRPAEAPDRNDEYALLQLLLGTWPVGLLDDAPVAGPTIGAYAGRIKSAMTKAMREAKVHTTWASPNAAYEAATLAFVDAILTGALAPRFLEAFRPFARRIAGFGARNGIIQTVLKLTLPGVPDFYQGTELWDLSMVDPDNRRPVDFTARAALLTEVEAALAEDRAAAMGRFARDWPDGRIKLALIAAILACRREKPSLFANGDYRGIAAHGPGADEVCAFVRRHGASALLVAVARFPGRREGKGFDPDTGLTLPAAMAPGGWTDVLTGRPFSEGKIKAGGLFEILPAVVLMSA